MIRLGKPVQLMEWGEGTSTVTQTWDKFAEGKLLNKSKYAAGELTIVIEVGGPVTRKNEKNDDVKIMQQGEAMTSKSERWGEVAMGKLKSIDSQSGKTIVSILVRSAAKIC